MTSYNHNGGPPIVEEIVPDDVDRMGWVAIHRGIRSHWLVGFYNNVQPADPARGSACHFVAFVDLIMECRYREGYVLNGGRKMKIEPGQLVGAVSWLANRWNWTPKKVRWFLEKLQEDGMIDRSSMGKDGDLEKTKKGNEGGKHASIISLCNFTKYQPYNKRSGHELSAKHPASEGQQGIEGTREQPNWIGESIELPLSEENSDHEIAKPRRRRVIPYSEAFENFWQAYPDKRNNSKQLAAAQWESLSTEEQTQAEEGLEHLRKHCRDNPDYRCVHAERYLSQRRWESYAPAAGSGRSDGKGWWTKPHLVAKATMDTWRKGIGQYAKEFWNVGYLGPPPGAPGCLIPRDLIHELELDSKYNEKGLLKGVYDHARG